MSIVEEVQALIREVLHLREENARLQRLVDADQAAKDERKAAAERELNRLRELARRSGRWL